MNKIVPALLELPLRWDPLRKYRALGDLKGHCTQLEESGKASLRRDRRRDRISQVKEKEWEEGKSPAEEPACCKDPEKEGMRLRARPGRKLTLFLVSSLFSRKPCGGWWEHWL